MRGPQEEDSRRERRMADVLRASREESFAPGFADRVMARLPADGGPPIALDAALRRQFRRLVPIAAAAALALVVHNVFLSNDASQTPFEAALGLRPVTLDVAYAFDPNLYSTDDAATESAP